MDDEEKGLRRMTGHHEGSTTATTFEEDSNSSKTSSPSTQSTPPSYPEGGLQAWLTVCGAFVGLFCTFGQLNAFGTFQTWYAEHQLHNLPPSTIAWIGSLQLWIFFFSVRNYDHSSRASLPLPTNLTRVASSDVYLTSMVPE